MAEQEDKPLHHYGNKGFGQYGTFGQHEGDLGKYYRMEGEADAAHITQVDEGIELPSEFLNGGMFAPANDWSQNYLHPNKGKKWAYYRRPRWPDFNCVSAATADMAYGGGDLDPRKFCIYKEMRFREQRDAGTARPAWTTDYWPKQK